MTSMSIRSGISPATARPRSSGLAAMAAAELASGLLGFSATVHVARSLGPAPFARLEFASVVAAWLLVIVRGGIEQVVWREAARRPGRIGILSGHLMGLKAALAMLGFLVASLIAFRIGGEAGVAIAIAALILPASALSVDVAPRALGCFGPVALGQAIKAAGYALATAWLVSGPGHLIRSASCFAGAELIGGLVPTLWQVRTFGWPRPRFRRRAWLVLARRGAIASLTRFGRVGLFGADVLVLGWLGSRDLGAYSASRRLLFAAVSLGLIVPTVFAPTIASAFAVGFRKASSVVAEAYLLVWAASVPAAIMLGLAGGRWSRLIFGPSYAIAGAWLALLAARLPWLLSTSLGQSALVACRGEGRALGVIASMTIASVILLPAAGSRWGVVGVGGGLLLIEAAGSIAMIRMLHRLDILPNDRLPNLRRGAKSP